MNWLSFKRWVFILMLCMVGTDGFSNTINEGTERYKKRIDNYRDMWESLMPTYTKLQYAGGMGLMNIGIGWSYGKMKQWETDVFLGFIPRYASDNSKITFTLKQNLIPWQKFISKRWVLEPFTCSLYFNTVFSDEFWTNEPDRYPKGYYGFSTRIRTHISVGQRMRYMIPDKNRFFSRSITAFYEISTCDFYLVSAFGNHLHPFDYLRLSFGIKFDIF